MSYSLVEGPVKVKVMVCQAFLSPLICSDEEFLHELFEIKSADNRTTNCSDFKFFMDYFAK